MNLIIYYPVTSFLLQEKLKQIETRFTFNLDLLDTHLSGDSIVYYNRYSSMKLFIISDDHNLSDTYEIRVKNLVLHRNYNKILLVRNKARMVSSWKVS